MSTTQFESILERSIVIYLGYAVLERSESLGIHSIDGEVFLDRAAAEESAIWHADHLTGSYADAGDTTCEIVGVVLSADQHADIAAEFDGSLAG